MHLIRIRVAILALVCAFGPAAFAQAVPAEACPRGVAGDAVPEPQDLRSRDGILRVDFSYRTMVDGRGLTRYCYLYNNTIQSPTLRVKPGDQLTITLRNELPAASTTAIHTHAMAASGQGCGHGPMTASSTNLHFHGLVIPPVCHQDDTLKTWIQPGDPPFEYSFKIPSDQPPGLYWYHPHVHGFNKAQVLGGASGALIVEGMETVDDAVSGLPELVLVIRDQELLNPDAAPVQSDSMPAPQVLRDAEGDILNTGTGKGKPAKDLSINFVPVSYPQYQPAVIVMKPQQRQLWRVVNASAITYLDLQLLFNGRPQQLGVVAEDGVPVNENGNQAQKIVWKGHSLIPPAGRMEFIVQGPGEGVRASLVTRTVDSGPAGENDPTRPLATIRTSVDAPERLSLIPASPRSLTVASGQPLREATPVRERKLYFSEVPQDPKNPNSPTAFFLTVDGKTPAPFDPHAPDPNIVVRQGEVEDWIIENRSLELHDFHIHQTHFQLLQWNGVPVDEPYLRDTVNVPYWDGHSSVFPSVKIRVDFRSPALVGTFVYHCHLLEHEDGGMMGTIRVEAPGNSAAERRSQSPRVAVRGSSR